MVALLEGKREVVVFSPTESLILQVAQWAGRHRDYSVRLVCSKLAGNISAALDTAAFSIIDATVFPQDAISILALTMDRVGSERIAVYTEIELEEEVFIRSRGISLLLGPIGPQQWEALLERLGPVEAHLNTNI